MRAREIMERRKHSFERNPMLVLNLENTLR